MGGQRDGWMEIWMDGGRVGGGRASLLGPLPGAPMCSDWPSQSGDSSCAAQMLSPHSRGLFRRAVSQGAWPSAPGLC